MELTNLSRRFMIVSGLVVCLVMPLLVGCGSKSSSDAPKEDPQMQQMRKQKKDG